MCREQTFEVGKRADGEQKRTGLQLAVLGM